MQKARALWVANRFDEAVGLFAQTAEQHPDHVGALVDAARALGHRHEIHRAETLLDKLATVASDRADLLFLTGQTWRMIFREDRAIGCLEAFVATTAGRRHADAHFELAVLYERRHRTTECAATLQQVMKLDPGYLEALILKARLYRRAGEAGRAATVLHRVLKSHKAHPFAKAQAWYALADLSDKEGDYATAVARLERGKAILREHAAVPLRHSAIVLGQLESIDRAVTAADFRRWAAGHPDPDNPARVVQLTSFPRSGTTLLENILDAHPAIVSSEEREVFGRDLLGGLWKEPHESSPPTVEAFDRIPDEKLRRLRHRYLASMEEALGESMAGRIHIDKNPTHTLFIPALWRLFPETRFLVPLRDPRDVVVSCFFQYLPLNPHSVCFLSWEATARRYALDMGLWTHFREHLPDASWREVRYENLVTDLAVEARGVLEFLGVGWDDSVLGYRESLGRKTVRSPTYLDVAQPVHTRAVGRWKNYERWLEPVLEHLEPMVRAFEYT